MSEDYFTRLDAVLAARTRDGAHLPGGPRRLARATRRAAAATVLALALAVSLVSEFPASAEGRCSTPPALRAAEA